MPDEHHVPTESSSANDERLDGNLSASARETNAAQSRSVNIDGVNPGKVFSDDTLGDYSTLFEDALLLENYKAAETHLTGFKSRYGKTPQYLYHLGKLRVAQHKMREAYEIFKRLYFDYPVFMGDKTDYENIKGKLLTIPIEKTKAQWNQVLATASRYYEAKDGKGSENTDEKSFSANLRTEIDKVVAIYRDILEIEPYNLAALRGLSHCFTEVGKAALVLECQDKIREGTHHWSELDVNRSKIILAEARKHLQAEDSERAIEILEIGLMESPAGQNLLVMKTEALLLLRKYEAAANCADLILKVNPASPDGTRLKKKIESLKLEDLLAKAIELLIEAESKEPGSKYRLLKAQESLAIFSDIVAQDSLNLTAMSGMYRCHVILNNPLKAQRILEQIRDIDPGYNVQNWHPAGMTTSPLDETCFVATRIFGRGAPHVITLQMFRENRLKNSLPGKIFIALYNRIGPALARISPAGPLIDILKFLITAIVSILPHSNGK